VAVHLGRGLAEAGDEVHLLSTAVPAALPAHHGMRVHPVEPPDHPVFTHEPVSLALTGALAQLHRQAPLDVIHAHFAVPWAMVAATACDVLGAQAPPVVVTLHGSDVFQIGAHPLYVDTTRAGLQRASSVTAVSYALRDAARTELGACMPIEVIPNFVRTPGPTATRDEHEPPVLAHVSNFRKVKRPLDALQVFARVRQHRPVRLRLVGEGPELEAVRSRARELGLLSDIDFVGIADEVIEELARADVLLMPSERESFGLAALEAQAAGAPVVGTAVDGLPEVVADGETGLLHEVGDVDAMAQSVEYLLANHDVRMGMADAGRRRARDLFDESHTVQRYRATYERAQAARHRGASTAA
jgi:N-acetyl-alpha-D-glucosaminyl L-malate synthase BshA